MVKECANGVTVRFTVDHGITTRSTEKVVTNGKMEECTMETMSTIKSMDLVFISGQMEECMLANGHLENMTQLESTFCQMEK